jgi:hypothetical protein
MTVHEIQERDGKFYYEKINVKVNEVEQNTAGNSR